MEEWKIGEKIAIFRGGNDRVCERHIAMKKLSAPAV